tara:strand:+ start:1446 stop:2030 length:585 start_codon:yes stop_codon:yes gene_type:complete
MKRKDQISFLEGGIEESLKIINSLKENISLYASITAEVARAFKKGNKVLFCGNGGSAADAQHLAAELAGKFKKDRRALFAEALHTNTSSLTAIANDMGYENVYSRMVESKGRKGDVLFGLSTSGESENVLKAIKLAKDNMITTVLMTGDIEDPEEKIFLCDYIIKVPSKNTPRIQEAHILIGHILCELVEEILF